MQLNMRGESMHAKGLPLLQLHTSQVCKENNDAYVIKRMLKSNGLESKHLLLNELTRVLQGSTLYAGPHTSVGAIWSIK